MEIQRFLNEIAGYSSIGTGIEIRITDSIDNGILKGSVTKKNSIYFRKTVQKFSNNSIEIAVENYKEITKKKIL